MRARRRKPIRRTLIVSHRWLSLILGTVLVVICTSGALLVYEPEFVRATNGSLFATTSAPAPVGYTRAVEAVKQADPEFEPAYLELKDGVYFISAADEAADTYFVDAGTGRVNGHGRPEDGGFVGFLVNLHDCGLSCEGYPGYLPWLAQPSPIASFTPFADMTWAAVILGATGLLLVFLAISGLVIWWPGLKRWRHGFRLRLGRGRFARDYDLHNVIGVLAAVPLLIWGLTGMNFEIPAVGKIWYSATGAEAPADDVYSMEPSARPGPQISLDEAIAAATAQFPGSQATWIGLPDAPDGYYSVDLQQGGRDLWRYNAQYHANREVGVDSHDPTVVKEFKGVPKSLSADIIQNWAQPALHYGFAVNGWWRILWFVFGMAPLALMITGVSTWLYRRRVAAQKKTAIRTRAVATRTDDSDRPDPVPA